jgi:hypothetical protein
LAVVFSLLLVRYAKKKSARPAIIGMYLLLVAVSLVGGFTILQRGIGNAIGEFGDALLMESYGMLFDLLVFGVLFLWLMERGKKRQAIEKDLDLIEDLRGIRTRESAARIRGGIIRLAQKGVNQLDLSQCYLNQVSLKSVWLIRSSFVKAELNGAILDNARLDSADFQEADLKNARLEDAILTGAIFWSADMTFANLTRADLTGVQLKNAILKDAVLNEADLTKASVTPEQLSTAKTLYKARLDKNMETEIKNGHPHLLKKTSVPG